MHQDRFGFLCPSRPVKRTQRYPQYSDDELKPFFAEVAAGYCVRQSAERVGLDINQVLNTLYSDDETIGHVIDLSIAAGGRIRAGKQPIPNRLDGLYKEFEDITDGISSNQLSHQ